MVLTEPGINLYAETDFMFNEILGVLLTCLLFIVVAGLWDIFVAVHNLCTGSPSAAVQFVDIITVYAVCKLIVRIGWHGDENIVS